MVHPPNIGPALHIHPNAPEAYYVLEGEYNITFGKEGSEGELNHAKKGDFVFIPKGVEHKYQSGPAGGRVLVISPAGLRSTLQRLQIFSRLMVVVAVQSLGRGRRK